MHKTPDEAVEFVQAFAPANLPTQRCRARCVPAVHRAQRRLRRPRGLPVSASAHSPCTGRNPAHSPPKHPRLCSPALAEYVIIGHSEVRAYLDETDERVNKKVKAALAHGLKPIIAVGESLEENEAGEVKTLS